MTFSRCIDTSGRRKVLGTPSGFKTQGGPRRSPLCFCQLGLIGLDVETERPTRVRVLCLGPEELNLLTNRGIK